MFGSGIEMQTTSVAAADAVVFGDGVVAATGFMQVVNSSITSV